MIRHLLKLAWNRKRANALIIAEIFLSFFVLFAVLTISVALLASWRKPLGFQWENVWAVELGGDDDLFFGGNEKLAASVDRMLREVKSLPEVVDASASMTPAFGFGTIQGNWNVDGRKFTLDYDEVTDGFANVMQIKMVSGRWFRPDDDAATFQPVVLDRSAAEAVFPGKNPIGEKFDPDSEREMRVVGVIDDYRKGGELSFPTNMVFRRTSLAGGKDRVGRYLLLRVAPGTPAEFEETLQRRLQSVAPEMSFRVQSMPQWRRTMLKTKLGPLAFGGIVAAFLIAMVALGLTGVLWQNVTKRTRELGVRRALGASGSTVRKQVLGEVVMLATFAVVAGLLIIVQLPVVGVFAWLPLPAFITGVLVSLATIYALTLLCGWYPSWLASRITPAEALRYE